VGGGGGGGGSRDVRIHIILCSSKYQLTLLQQVGVLYMKS
jgi:hypothetical protein